MATLQHVLEYARKFDTVVLPIAASRNISDCLWDSFPMLYRLVLRSADHTVPGDLRPLIAEWCRKLFVIYNFRSDVYHAPIRVNTRGHVRDVSQSTLGELRGLYEDLLVGGIVADVEPAQIHQLIIELVECEVSVKIDRDNLRSGGHVVGPMHQWALMRAKLHEADVASDTNGKYASLNLPRPRRKGAAAAGGGDGGDFEGWEGVLGKCQKTEPSSSGFLGGLFVTVCLCCSPKIFACTMMDAGESPRNQFEMLESMPYGSLSLRLAVYDNACHARQYQLMRASHKFFGTLTICDRFHASNHKACSKCFSPDQWKHIPWIKGANTSAMEQINAELVRHLASFVSFQCPAFAMDTLELFIAAFNSARHPEGTLPYIYYQYHGFYKLHQYIVFSSNYQYIANYWKRQYIDFYPIHQYIDSNHKHQYTDFYEKHEYTDLFFRPLTTSSLQSEAPARHLRSMGRQYAHLNLRTSADNS